MLRLSVIASVFWLLTSWSASTTTELSIEVKGFPSNEGKAFIAIFRETDDFPVYGAQFKGVLKRISNKTSSAQFSDLAPGKYAVAVFHDKNGNGKLDRNLLGIPTEYYGFSNGAREMFSAPSFESASFMLSRDRKITIQVK